MTRYGRVKILRRYVVNPIFGEMKDKASNQKDQWLNISVKAGVKCPMTSLEDWMKKEDWTPVFDQ